MTVKGLERHTNLLLILSLLPLALVCLLFGEVRAEVLQPPSSFIHTAQINFEQDAAE